MSSSAEIEIDLTWQHEVGVFLADQIERVEDLPLLIEVVARKSMRMAPLHGAVWHSLEKFADGASTAEMFRIIDEQLCFFRDMPNMMDLYMSCVHGVGHGLSMVYGMDRAVEAVRICGESEDHDFQYSCATGIFMSLLEPVMKGMAPPVPVRSWTPCDAAVYPAACFRFKLQSMSRAMAAELDFCDRMGDTYHSMGCVWGAGYVAKGLGYEIEECHEFCAYSTQSPMR